MYQLDAFGAFADPIFALQLIAEPSRSVVAVVGILVILLLILLSAFFASSEIAIFSLADYRISALVEDGVHGAGTLETLKSNPRRLLVTILVGNNIANIAMSSITTGLLGMYFGASESVLIATFGVTSLVLLFGESAPKSYAVEHSESWSLRIARPLRIAQYALFPLVAVFDVLTRGVNRIMGSQGDFESAYVTRAEILDMIETGQRGGVLTDEEHLMLQRILRFRNRTVKETMVPRLDVVAVSANEDLSTAIEASLSSDLSRLPMYEETLDEVIGTVHVRDLLAARTRGEDATIRGLGEDAYIVPETNDIDDLLVEMRENHREMAIVVDEFGTMSGIVTMEDIVEQIIGEILTETETVPIRWIDDRTALVRGEVNIHDVNEMLGIDLPETGEFESIAGFVFDRAGRIVDEGETVAEDDVRLVVETVENNRILEVRVKMPESAAPAEGDSR